MKLKATGFSPNRFGDLKGTFVAYADSGEPLGVEHTGNYSQRGGKELLEKLAAAGIDSEIAQVLLRKGLVELRGAADQVSEETPAAPREHSLPTVETADRQLREIVDDCWGLIHQANTPEPVFFRFGDELVDLSTTGRVTSPRVLSLVHLRGHLDRRADFIKTRADGIERAGRPPQDVTEDMLALLNPELPSLVSVVGSPVCASDGTVITSEGYHGGTGLYLALKGVEVPEVSDSPSPDEVQRALDLLLSDLLGDFPFTSESDRAHALAALMNPLARPMIDGPTPLFLIEAPSPGTGKGLFADVVSLIASGGDAAAMTEAHGDDEWRKRLTAALVKSPPLVLLDNLTRRLESPSLSSALTARNWGDRYLGSTRIVRVPVTTTWLATANNPSLSNEIARRVARIRIDAGDERPWERAEFRHPNLRSWVREHRPDLLWSLFTLLRAWVAAGRPKGTEVMGSFESWAATMGGILAVAEVPGFLVNRKEVYAQVDAETEAWRSFFRIWWHSYKEHRVGTDKLLDLAKEHRLLTELRSGRSDRGARTSMGIHLAKWRDRRVGEYRVRHVGQAPDGRAALYRLELVVSPAEVRSGSEGSEAQP